VSPERTSDGTPSRPGEFHPEPLTDPDLILGVVQSWVTPATGLTLPGLTMAP
jgi:hypothetical protein